MVKSYRDNDSPFTPDNLEVWNVESVRHVRNLAYKCAEYFIANGSTSISVLDVGSNIGKFTELLDQQISVSNAILIDPVSELVEYSKNIFKGYNYNYEVLALGNEVGTTSVYFPTLSDKHAFNLGTSKLHPDGQRVVDITKFDILWESKYRGFRPDLIKVDAEGYDIRVLQGMEKFITSLDTKPMIVFELEGYNLSSEGCDKILSDIRFLTRMGYTSYWHDTITPPYSCDVALVSRVHS